MKIRETTMPAPRRFEIELLDSELQEIAIAFHHMLAIKCYTDDNQRELITRMLESIKEARRQ